ncbi:hypothetical protein SLEP1_g10878 [Rubroshorea leprosula]|uniref:Secreted protein n=1 Tax=Rubroshorea leprosula TaxID=152421 RepID=A0AAV5IIY5_9ROSI|nr:hypothetical protein SLEP1_g10878 [Rubroshorea leprosula]
MVLWWLPVHGGVVYGGVVYGGAVLGEQQQPELLSGDAGTARRANVCEWYHTLSYQRLWMQLASPFHGDNSTPLYHTFIVMEKFGLVRFTPSQPGGLVGVLFRFHIVHAPTMGKVSHCCPSGYGEAIHG